MPDVLIIDDEAHMRRIISVNLTRAHYHVAECAGVGEGKSRIMAQEYDAVFVDQRMPDGLGLEVVRCARETDPSLAVVMLTGVATLELAVDAMRQGAFDFLAKPFEPEVLLSAAGRACERTALLRENRRLRDEVRGRGDHAGIDGPSPAMILVRSTIARVAPTNATVVITGETGTGKELVARAIHNQSPRASRPFIPVNCAAFTESLLESELFGHEKGAFTGADRNRQGLFEAADQGTLFLDEIGEMSLAAQAKLLRVLTDGNILRVGSTQLRKVDVRVLAATHRNLKTMIEEGRFRQDLYYRLAVVPIAIPALRERPEDIPILCETLSRRVSRELKVPQRTFLPEALTLLSRYHYPGNVRELHNVIERAYILSAGDPLGPDSFAPLTGDLPAALKTAAACPACPALTRLPEGFDLPEFLEHIEQSLLTNTLEASGGTQAEAARRLGLSRSVLAYKVAKYGIRSCESPVVVLPGPSSRA
jgi:DNA-binding NtrC family response regulator